MFSDALHAFPKFHTGPTVVPLVWLQKAVVITCLRPIDHPDAVELCVLAARGSWTPLSWAQNVLRDFPVLSCNTSLHWCELHLTGKKVGSGKVSDLQGFASNMGTAVKLALERLSSAQLGSTQLSSAQLGSSQSLRNRRMYLLEILKGDKNA